jgi:hypothetical protein
MESLDMLLSLMLSLIETAFSQKGRIFSRSDYSLLTVMSTSISARACSEPTCRLGTRRHLNTHATPDAAFDARFVYQASVHHGRIAAIPINSHGHPDTTRDTDGMLLCDQGERKFPTYPFNHTNGSGVRFFCRPLPFPQSSSLICSHGQFTTGKGCVKHVNLANHLNTLIYVVNTLRALQRAKSIQTRLLPRE